ncbi:hypothetical protein I302_100056 [Kwoniella bestiolae CBS 10118]|uniref:Uncharacterized protein n=1 Tax=Kwoniella bestiolae CBS 10118 TaxID=1296100 RepID=A0A1B9G3Z4_9TREE|nr:hypothetical protein I302_03428 [Kwoniella bestiolae CBS 10118]OCF25755.1 hypothetical protein I302_03428 [Kwoniella bestiolae CBS 10118]
MTSRSLELPIPQWANDMSLTEAEAVRSAGQIEGYYVEAKNKEISNSEQAEAMDQGLWSYWTSGPSPWDRWRNYSQIQKHKEEVQRGLANLTSVNARFQELAKGLYEKKIAEYSESVRDELSKLRCSSIIGGDSISGLQDAISTSYRENATETSKIQVAVNTALSRLLNHASSTSGNPQTKHLPWSVQLDSCNLDIKVKRESQMTALHTLRLSRQMSKAILRK